MKTFLVFLLLFALNVVAAYDEDKPQNTNYLSDTCSVTDTLDSATVYFADTVFSLTDGEDVGILCLVDDTAEAGFASDSVNFRWGYIRGYITFDSSFNIDTSWGSSDTVVVCTMNVANYGTGHFGTIAANLALTDTLGSIDTIDVTGFAVQGGPVVPKWAELFKIWVQSLGGANKDAAALRLYFQIKRRPFVGVRLR